VDTERNPVWHRHLGDRFRCKVLGIPNAKLRGTDAVGTSLWIASIEDDVDEVAVVLLQTESESGIRFMVKEEI